MYPRTLPLPEAIQKLPNCSLHVLTCMECTSPSSVTLLSKSSIPHKFTWCQPLSCPRCQNCWYFCTICTYQRQFKKEQLLSHHQYHHSSIPPSKELLNRKSSIPVLPPSPCNSSSDHSFSALNLDDNFDSENYSCSDENSSFHTYNHCLKHLLFHPSTQLDSTLLSGNDQEIFQYWHKQNKSIQYLMARCYFHNKRSITNISLSDATLNLQIFDFIRQLSRPLQSDFANILQSIRPHMLPSSNIIVGNDSCQDDHTSSCNPLVLPSSYSDIRNTYLRGKHSMLQNISSVPVHTIGCGKNLHSYVSVHDCVKHFLSFGGFGIVELDDRNEIEISSIFNSQRCHECSKSCISLSNHKESLFILPVVLFTDDFDPSISLVKANKKSIWMYSLTFKNQNMSKTRISHTYILSLGNKGSDHSPVLKMIEKELNSIRRGSLPLMYHGTLGKNVHPIVFPILRHGDQPERRAINMLKLGKETNHARWMYSLDIKKCGKYLPSCAECIVKVNNCLETYDINADSILNICCSQCSNWSFDRKYKFLHTVPHENFPKDSIPQEGLLPPMHLSKNLIKEAVSKTHRNIKNGLWSSANGRSYLDYFCVKTDIINSIVEKATNAHNLKIAKESSKEETTLKFILEDSEKYPELYSIHQLSHIIEESTDDLDSFPDTPMHLYSGYVKATMSLVMIFLRRKGMYNTFLKLISKDKTTEYLSSMKLQWLKIIPYTSDKFASYGCENHLSLCSIFKLQALFLLKLDYNVDIQFPTTSPTKWTANINRKWLSIHGYNTNGNAKELKERVAKYMQNDNENMVLKIHLINVQDITRMLVSVYNSVNLLMCPTVSKEHSDKTHCYIIKALNDIHKVDSHVRANQASPIWFLKYNLLCLLNCKENLNLYGPTRDRWEGSEEGEKGIQIVKKEFVAFRKGYQVQTHKKVNLTQSIQNIKIHNNITNANISNKHNNPHSMNKKFVKYKNTIVFTSKLVRNHPISLVCINRINDNGRNMIGFVTSSNNFYPLQNIVFQCEKNFCSLFTIGKISLGIDCFCIQICEEDIIEYIVALPYILNDIKKFDNKLFFFITKSGKELNKYYEFKHPHL